MPRSLDIIIWEESWDVLSRELNLTVLVLHGDGGTKNNGDFHMNDKKMGSFNGVKGKFVENVIFA